MPVQSLDINLRDEPSQVTIATTGAVGAKAVRIAYDDALVTTPQQMVIILTRAIERILQLGRLQP